MNATPSNQISRACLVTGGNRGIGRDISLSLAQAGYAVGVHFRSGKDQAEEVAERIREAGGVAEVFQADLAREVEIGRMMVAVKERFGGLYALINNAGWENVHHAIDMPSADFRQALDVNLTGPFLCSQAAARMMEHTGGVLVNNLSIHDTVPRKGLAHYCASKAGMLMLTRCLALEWAEYGIRVVGVSPGAIETDMNRGEIERMGRHTFEEAIPAGRIGDTSDVAGLVAFLVSDAASYITGTTIYTDGGYMQTTVPYDPRPPREPENPTP